MKRKKYLLQFFVIFAVVTAYGNKVTFDDGVCMTPGGIKQCKGKKIIASPAQGNHGKCAKPRAVEMFLEIAEKGGTNWVELPELGEDEWVDENKLFFVESSGKTRTINHVSSNDLVPLTHIRIYIYIGRPYIQTRQLCAVESAVRNANVTVILIVTSPRLDLDANNATRQIHDLSRGQRGARPNDGVAGSLHIRTVDPIRLFARCAQINDPARTMVERTVPCSDLGRAEERIASSVEATMQF